MPPEPKARPARSAPSSSRPPEVALTTKPIATGPTETGWLPDCVYTGEKFESGLAFFVDALGRIVRFSREPADLAKARRLAGQAALPGMVNTHSHAFLRALRGRGDAADRLLGALTPDDMFDVARLAFLEILRSGVTCVGEFHYLHHAPGGAAAPEPNLLAHEILRAAHDVGIRIALLRVASMRHAHPRTLTATADQFVRDTEALRLFAEKNYPADDVWLGLGAQSVAAVPLDAFKTIGSYAHAQRMRLHVHLPVSAEEQQACVAEHRRAPAVLLAENGIVDKRFTAIGGAQLSDDEIKVLGTARATVCCVPGAATPIEKLVAAGAGVAVGADTPATSDLLEEARRAWPSAPAARLAANIFHAATVTGARSLGATGGALEVGRPADFFTVNLLDPSLAGSDPASLLQQVLFGLDRRAIHEVWVGARQQIAAGRHANQGTIVSRFADAQKRLWAG
jgi:formimidoylglutamate deiminase